MIHFFSEQSEFHQQSLSYESLWRRERDVIHVLVVLEQHSSVKELRIVVWRTWLASGSPAVRPWQNYFTSAFLHLLPTGLNLQLKIAIRLCESMHIKSLVGQRHKYIMDHDQVFANYGRVRYKVLWKPSLWRLVSQGEGQGHLKVRNDPWSQGKCGIQMVEARELFRGDQVGFPRCSGSWTERWKMNTKA